MSAISDGLMVTLGSVTRDGTVTYTNREFWQIKRAVEQVEVALERRLRQEYDDEENRQGGLGITYDQFKIDALKEGG